MLDFLFNDPVRHGVDIECGDIASNTVCLQDRCTTAHEWVGYMATCKIVCFVKDFPKWLSRELRQK